MPGLWTGLERSLPSLLFRGGFNAQPAFFPGETIGPYMSQFCLVPTFLGRVPLDQKIKTLKAGKDFMTKLENGSTSRTVWRQARWKNLTTSIGICATGRDSAAYTQADELYQGYLIAYLVCSTLGIKANPQSPYVSTFKNEKAFGTFGGPDITATLGAVARAAHQRGLVSEVARPPSPPA